MSTRFIQGTPVNYQGRTDGAAVPAGMVGQTESNSGSLTALTSGQFGDRGQLTLTAGVWMITGSVRFAPAASTVVTRTLAGITTTAGNSSSGTSITVNTSDTYYPAGYVPADQITINTPPVFVNISSNTTYYLKALSNFTTSTCSADGTLKAIRIA